MQSSAGGLSDFFKNPRNCIDTALGVLGVVGLAGTAYFWNRQRKLDAAMSKLSVDASIVVKDIWDRFRNWIDVVMCSGDSFLEVEIGKDDKVVVNIFNCRDNSAIGFTETKKLNESNFTFAGIEDKVYGGAMTRLGRNLIEDSSVNGGFCITFRHKKFSCCMVEYIKGVRELVRKFNVGGAVDVMKSFNSLVEDVKEYFDGDGGANIESCSLDLIESVIEAAGKCIIEKEIRNSVEASVISKESGEKIISRLEGFKFIDFNYLKRHNVFDNMGVQICDARDKNKKKVALKKMRTWRQEYNELASK